MLSPFFFLDIAKKGRLYSSITDVVLENSFGALKKTTKDITINISALDIEKTSTREKIFELLEQYKDDRSRIIMELLEDESVKDFDTIRYFIIKVKSQGVRIAIDDFGAGYSNFERLLDYQPDIIKIDGCLIKNILIDDFSLDVVETIVAFAKKQNIKTVAEFVENADIYTLLTKLGVDYSQGYYFGKPDTL
jgi:EAL domain-containing protein (putative c-di-GMP-specific phosphodiesterase class I)